MLLKLHVCETKLKELEPKTHKLRKSFMLNRLKHHKDQGDAKGIQEVQCIIVKIEKRKWKRISSTFGKAKSLPASKIATKSKGGGHVVYLDKLDIHLALRGHLGKRLQTACDSPITKGKVFQDLGHLTNTNTANAMLQGS